MPRLADLGRPAAETKLLRRVLAHLPDWAEDEAAFVAMEGGPEKSIRSYNLPDFTARLGEDVFSQVDTPPRPMSQAEVAAGLQLLAGAGFASAADGEYRMTAAGRDELTRGEEAPDQQAGPVFLDLAPAVAETEATA